MWRIEYVVAGALLIACAGCSYEVSEGRKDTLSGVGDGELGKGVVNEAESVAVVDAPAMNDFAALLDNARFAAEVSVAEVGDVFFNTRTGERKPEDILGGSEEQYVVVDMDIRELYLFKGPVLEDARKIVLPIRVYAGGEDSIAVSHGGVPMLSEYEVGTQGILIGGSVGEEYLDGPHQPYWDYVFDLVAQSSDATRTIIALDALAWYRFEGQRVVNGSTGIPVEDGLLRDELRARLITEIEDESF